ncbi:hypothetical protein E5288_WYG009069 [Bos mutus]|uniref:Immunoglobulin C1-set domain-containing protein n=1 Tax=Bos mutus TaxID=72004 RepID=A0A6B0QSE2_9CETA|nr:hypothetical protein [Bos mutus]
MQHVFLQMYPEINGPLRMLCGARRSKSIRNRKVLSYPLPPLTHGELGIQRNSVASKITKALISEETQFEANQKLMNYGECFMEPEDPSPHVAENAFNDFSSMVYWREKRGNRVLPSQQGNTVKTADTYMKFSWLTVSGNSTNKEHMCIVKHEKNKRGDNQEILFPPVNEVVSSVVTATKPPNDGLKNKKKQVPVVNSTKACLKDENNTLQLHLMNTSAYYTYLLLLITSTVYLVIITSCVFRRTGVCGIQKSS